MTPDGATLHNVAEIVPDHRTGEPVFCRIPESLRINLNEKAQRGAFHSAGCEVRFRLTSESITLKIRACQVGAEQNGGKLAQILFGDFSHTYFPIETTETVIQVTAPNYARLEMAPQPRQFHPRLMRVLLPTHAAICQCEIEGDIAPPELGDVPALRALFYGSSITQASGSLTARESWAGRCAHLLGADIINLGFGGGCNCEPEMADYLAKRDDFDFAVLETGINMLGLDRALADERIAHLLRNVASAHPEKPVFCVGVFPCLNDFATGLHRRAGEFRELVKSVIAQIDSSHFHYLDGAQAMNPAFGLTTDLIHPSPSGMISIAEWAASEIRAKLPAL